MSGKREEGRKEHGPNLEGASLRVVYSFQLIGNIDSVDERDDEEEAGLYGKLAPRYTTSDDYYDELGIRAVNRARNDRDHAEGLQITPSRSDPFLFAIKVKVSRTSWLQCISAYELDECVEWA